MSPPPSTSSSRRGLSVDRRNGTRSRVKVKDDDLALFKDMQMKERDDFLLSSTDDLEDSLSKLKYFPELNTNIAVEGASNDLLNADCEKNDYEWLLTPPATPLFPSLDKGDLGMANQARQISISSSSSQTESRGRKSRSSVSPRGPSPSSRSTAGFPVTGRSPTPPIKRTNSTSSVKASRGSSPSPKLHRSQTNASGHRSEASSVLQASRARGLSPTCKNRGDGLLKNGENSISPAASASFSSSHSQDQDSFSNHTKSSIVSSGDVLEDSSRFLSLVLRRNGGIMGQPNKLQGAMSTRSAPKCSFDSAIHKMDHHTTSEDLLLRMLTDARGIDMLRPMFSMNASTITSSDGNSDAEGGKRRQNDAASRAEKTLDVDSREEIFSFDKKDGVAVIEDEIYADKPQQSHGEELGESMERKIGGEELEQQKPGLAGLPNASYAFPLYNGNSQKLEPAEECAEVITLDVPKEINSQISKCKPTSSAEITTPAAPEDINNQISKCEPTNSAEITTPDVPEDINDQISKCDPASSAEIVTPDLPEDINSQISKCDPASCAEVMTPSVPENISGQISQCKPTSCAEIITFDSPEDNNSQISKCEPTSRAEITTPDVPKDINSQISKCEPTSRAEITTPDVSEDINSQISKCDPTSSAEIITPGVPEDINSQISKCEPASTAEIITSDVAEDINGQISKCEPTSCVEIITPDSPKDINGQISNCEPTSSAEVITHNVAKDINGQISKCEPTSNAQIITPDVAKDINGQISKCEPTSNAQIITPDVAKDINGQISKCEPTTIEDKDWHAVLPEISSTALTENDGKDILPLATVECEPENSSICSRAGSRRSHSFSSYHYIGTDGLDRVGIPMLQLKRSNSDKGPLVDSGVPSVINQYSERQKEGFPENQVSCSKVDSTTITKSEAEVDCSAELPVEVVSKLDNNLRENKPALKSCHDELPSNLVNSVDDKLDQIPDSSLRTSLGGLSEHADDDDDDENIICLPIEGEVSPSSSCTVDASYPSSISLDLTEADSVHLDRAQGQSEVMVESPGGNKARCLTMEEATETILFCSSIVQDLGLEAAAIAIEKEQPPPWAETQPQAVDLPPEPASDEKSPGRRKSSEKDARKLVNGNIQKVSPLKADSPDKGGRPKPLKVDSSKMCSCTVM